LVESIGVRVIHPQDIVGRNFVFLRGARNQQGIFGIGRYARYHRVFKGFYICRFHVSILLLLAPRSVSAHFRYGLDRVVVGVFGRCRGSLGLVLKAEHVF
jgi:hypothetical protein